MYLRARAARTRAHSALHLVMGCGRCLLRLACDDFVPRAHNALRVPAADARIRLWACMSCCNYGGQRQVRVAVAALLHWRPAAPATPGITLWHS